MKNNICIDIGGSYIKYAIMKDNKIELYNFIKTDKLNILKQLESIIDKLAVDNYNKINMIGISIPGAVDSANGVVIHAINLNLYNFNLIKHLKEKFNFNFFIISDRDAGLIGCLKSVDYKFSKNVLAISWGTGVALSIYQNNKLYKSINRFAPEFGHIFISDNSNYKCFCGKKGCLNSISGAKAIRDRINEKLNLEGDNIVKGFEIAKQNNNKEITYIFQNAIYYLSKAISNIFNVFDPECIFVWGGLSEVAKYYYNDITRIVNESIHTSLKEKNKIIISNYGRKSAIYGINAIANSEMKI